MNQTVTGSSVKINIKQAAGFLLGLVICICLASCKTHDPGIYIEGMAQKKFAVMPFIKGKNPETIEQPLSCPFAQFCYPDQSIKEGADDSLTRTLQELLRKEMGYDVMTLAQVKTVYDPLKADAMAETPRSVAKKLGEALAVDYIMTGNVWRYKERIGTSFSVEQPASVAFGLYLVEVSTGKTLWRASYDKTQRSLTENLLEVADFFKQGAKWLTAEELARYGMEKILKQSFLE